MIFFQRKSLVPFLSQALFAIFIIPLNVGNMVSSLNFDQRAIIQTNQMNLFFVCMVLVFVFFIVKISTELIVPYFVNKAVVWSLCKIFESKVCKSWAMTNYVEISCSWNGYSNDNFLLDFRIEISDLIGIWVLLIQNFGIVRKYY